MQAVILAAGKGTRLYPLTLFRSKAMLPVLGKPMIARVMDRIACMGVREFILVIHPNDNEVQKYFTEESSYAAKVRFVYQEEPLGMAHALACAAPLICSDFILSACDNLTSFSHMRALSQRWRDSPPAVAVLSVMMAKTDQLRDSGVVCIENGWVRKIVEKPPLENAPSNIISLPLYGLPHDILAYLDEVPLSPRGEYELQDAIQMLIERKGKVCPVFTRNRLTLTTPSDLLHINRKFMKGKKSLPDVSIFEMGEGSRVIEPFYFEPPLRIGAYCTIGPYVYIEKGCIIQDRARIQEAVILRNTLIPEGAVIANQVVC